MSKTKFLLIPVFFVYLVAVTDGVEFSRGFEVADFVGNIGVVEVAVEHGVCPVSAHGEGGSFEVGGPLHGLLGEESAGGVAYIETFGGLDDGGRAFL